MVDNQQRQARELSSRRNNGIEITIAPRATYPDALTVYPHNLNSGKGVVLTVTVDKIAYEAVLTEDRKPAFRKVSEDTGVALHPMACEHDWFDCSNAAVQRPTKSCRKCGWTVHGNDDTQGMFIQWPWLTSPPPAETAAHKAMVTDFLERMKPAAARRWDNYFPGGQWLHFPGNHDGEKLYRAADVIDALTAALAQAETQPHAAMTVDHTGCEHMSRDIALIEQIAKDGGDPVTYLFASPAQSETQPVAWQPIETAPKDRTKIILWCESWLHPVMGYWSPTINSWLEYGSRDTKASAATHWQSLPPAPGSSPVPAKREAGVVKPLDWVPFTERDGDLEAVSVVGRYAIRPSNSTKRYRLFLSGTREPEVHLTIEEAKAAAQSDYEHRILSALSTSSTPADGEDRAAPVQGTQGDQNCGCDGAWDPDGCEKCTPAPAPDMRGDAE